MLSAKFQPFCLCLNVLKLLVFFFPDTVGYLLDGNDDKDKVNITNKDGRTCLHIAALTNNLELCKLLIARDADPQSLMEGKVGGWTL